MQGGSFGRTSMLGVSRCVPIHGDQGSSLGRLCFGGPLLGPDVGTRWDNSAHRPPLPQRNLTVRTVQRDPLPLGGWFWRRHLLSIGDRTKGSSSPRWGDSRVREPWGTPKGTLLASVGKVLAGGNRPWGTPKGILLASAGKVLAGVNRRRGSKGILLASAGKVLACGTSLREPTKGSSSPRWGKVLAWATILMRGPALCRGPKRSPRTRVAAKCFGRVLL